MFDNNIFYEHHIVPAMKANEIAFNQAEEMHRIACQQAFEMQNNQQQQAVVDNYDFEADFAATEAYIARLRAEIERDWNK